MKLYFKEEVFGYMISTYKNEIVYYLDTKNFNAYIEHNRALVRNYINFLEASVNFLNLYLLRCFKEEKFQLSDGELYILNGVRFFIDNNGKVKERPLLLSLVDNFKFSFTLFAEKHDRMSIYKKYMDSHFNNVVSVIQIRNRFTHPKTEEDPYVNDNEKSLAYESYKNYYEFQMELFKDYMYEKRKN